MLRTALVSTIVSTTIAIALVFLSVHASRRRLDDRAAAPGPRFELLLQ